MSRFANVERKAAAAVVAGLLGGALAFPASALALTTTRSYTWNNGEAQPTAASTVTENGTTYTLQGTSTPVQSNGSQTVTQQFSTTASGATTNEGAVQSAVPTSVPYSQDGYSGTLYRTSTSYTPIYKDNTQTDSATRSGTMAGTATSHPDDSMVASTMSKNGHPLQLSSVQWTHRDDGSGMSPIWDYVATYTGTYSTHDFDHYEVVGHYSGTLSKVTNNGSWSMVATYTAPDPVTDETNTLQEDSQQPVEQPQDEQQPVEQPQDEQQQPTDEQPTDEQQQPTDEQPTDEQPADDANANDGYDMAIDGNGNDENMTTSTNGNESGNENGNTSSSNTSGSSGLGTLIGRINANPVLWIIPIAIIAAIIALIAALLKRRKKGTAVVTVPAITIPTDIYAISSELIELMGDGEDSMQHPVATCNAVLSPSADTPTLVTVPTPPMRFEPAIVTDEDENPVLDENGNPMRADYYVVLGDTSFAAVATGLTDENGVITFEDVAPGRYTVSAIDHGFGLGSVINDGVTLYSGDTAQIALAFDGDSVINEDEVTRDAIGLYPGDCTLTVTVTNDADVPMSGATVDLFPSNLLAQAKSERLVIEANDYVVYDGVLANQIKVDADVLANAINGEPSEGMINIAQDIATWNNTYDAYDAQRTELIANFRDEQERKRQETEAAAAAAEQAQQEHDVAIAPSDDYNAREFVDDDFTDTYAEDTPTTTIGGDDVAVTTEISGKQPVEDGGYVNYADVANDSAYDDSDFSDDDFMTDGDETTTVIGGAQSVASDDSEMTPPDDNADAVLRDIFGGQ